MAKKKKTTSVGRAGTSAAERKKTPEAKAGDALGIVECRGITAAIEAADSMVKTADVEVIGTQKIGNALIYTVVTGKVDAVREAVKAGSETARRLGELYAAHVMPRPEDVVFEIVKIISG